MSRHNQSSSPKSYDGLLLEALRRALSPLVGFLLRRGITYPVLSTLIRGLYIEQAQQEFQIGDKPLADSRLSLLTGIARRYVKAIRKPLTDQKTHPPSKASPGEKLIAEWLTSPRYLDAHGKPASIPRLPTTDSTMPSYEALARRVNCDAWPSTLLKSMVDMGLLSIDDNDRVHLLTDAYLPSSNSLESLEYFADHLHDHLAVLSRNMLGKQSPLIERSANMPGLTEHSVQQVQQQIEEQSNELLQQVYKLAAERNHADLGSPNATHRLRLGIYFYTEDTHQTIDKEADKDD